MVNHRFSNDLDDTVKMDYMGFCQAILLLWFHGYATLTILKFVSTLGDIDVLSAPLMKLYPQNFTLLKCIDYVGTTMEILISVMYSRSFKLNL